MKAEEIKVGSWYRLYALNEIVQVVGTSPWMCKWRTRDGRWWSASSFAKEVPRPVTDPDGYEVSPQPKAKEESVMKIEIGKSYKTKSRGVFKVVSPAPRFTNWPEDLFKAINSKDQRVFVDIYGKAPFVPEYDFVSEIEEERTMKFDFEIGKKYRRRNGQVVTCEEVVRGEFGFVKFDEGIPVCIENGLCNGPSSPHPEDIVAEAPSLKVELGKTYLDGDGDEVAIIGTHLNGNFIGSCPDTHLAEFTPEGCRAEEDAPHDWHLVSEVPAAPIVRTFYVTAEVVLEVTAADEKQAREKALEDVARAEDLVNCNITHVCED